MKKVFIIMLLMTQSAYAIDTFNNGTRSQVNPYMQQIQQTPPVQIYDAYGNAISQDYYYNDPQTHQIRNNKGSVCYDTGLKVVCYPR